ncbi:MAG TPA: protein TolQ [Gammaproteobacteria bacterium]|jgi:biopolymer transport protein TolQ|nr:protein TolQ [Gammaproteobacteria bacterium]
MNSDLSILRLILDASPFVQAIMVFLLLGSVSSWAVIIDKSRVMKRASASALEFETSFWSGVDLSSLYREMARADATPQGMSGIFEAGFREFGKLKQSSLSPEQIIEGSRRAMRVSHLREMDRLEHNLAFLATVSNTSPYIGLLGTVWGIMSSFQALGGMQSATISVVAPYISEALAATAMGLIAAIPAGIFYNRYADRVSRLEVRYDTFMEELSAIFQRNAARRDPPGRGAGPVTGDFAEVEP